MAEVIRTDLKEPHDFIQEELSMAREKAQPISRRTLIQRLVKEYGMAYPIAEKVVEEYCDAQAPYCPEYLGTEFFKPYAKLAGFIFAIISLITLGIGVRCWESHQLSWPFFIGGAILFGLSGVGIFKVLKVEEEESAPPQ